MQINDASKTVPKPIEKPVEKPKPAITAQKTEDSSQFKNSILGGVQYTAETVKNRLQNILPAQTPTRQTPPSPYANQTADQIAAQQLEKYEKADDRQASAEETGRLIADIAKYEPEKAKDVADKFLNNDEVSGSDKDELAQEMIRALSDSEIQQIAGSEDGQTLLKQMQGHLLSGSVHGDEIADAQRVTTAIEAANGIFSSNDQGVVEGTEYSMSPLYPEATPEQGAHFLKMESNDASNAQMFADALEMHKNDPQWTRDFLKALGPDETARLMNGAVNPATYPGGYPETMQRNTANILNALETLRQSGDLKQAGMDGLVNSLSNNGFNPYIATNILSNASPELKEMFINSAIKNGNDTIEASAMNLLTTLPTDRQSAILEGLTVNGDSTKLNNFIAGAMAGRTEMRTLESEIKDPNNLDPNAPKVTIGKVEDLISTATDKTFQYYPYSSSSPFSEDLQNRLFNAASLGLNNPTAFDRIKDNVAFKDSMSTLFIQNRDALLKSNASSENGAITENGEKGLEKFFQLALMTPPRGENYDKLSHSVFTFINDGVTALSDPGLKTGDPAAFEKFKNEHGGMSPEDFTQMLGGVLGTIVDGAGNAQNEINKDNKERAAQVEFFTGLAFAMVPGAGSHLAKGITNGFVKHFAEQGVSYFQGKALGSIQETLNKGLSSLGAEKPSENGQLANTLFRQLLEKLPNGDAVYSSSEGRMVPTINLQEQLEIGFNTTTRYTLLDAATGGN